MDESKRLYFIPMIARALEKENPEHALREAFVEIMELSNRPEFKEGFLQFQQFVKAAASAAAETNSLMLRDAIDRLIVDLATDTFDGDEEEKASLVNSLERLPELFAEYKRLREESENVGEPVVPMRIEVRREGKLVGSSDIAREQSSIRPIIPGWYTVQMSNGRVLWEGELTPEDVLWAFAHPAEDLPLAAETEKVQAEPTRTISLLDGELIMRIFAGLEAGVVRIESGDRK